MLCRKPTMQLHSRTIVVVCIRSQSAASAGYCSSKQPADSRHCLVGMSTQCRAYLRRQILQYLESHMNVAPKAVILVAVLISDGQTPIPDAAARSRWA